MYRRVFGANLFFLDRDFIDFYIYVGLSSSGLIGFINENLAIYSVGSGISSSRNLMPYIEEAINLAASYGVNASTIASARSKQYFSYSISMAEKNNHQGFIENINMAKTWGGDRKKIALIYKFRKFSPIIFPLIRAYLYFSLIKKKFRDRNVCK
jgi:hypothetical protein